MWPWQDAKLSHLAITLLAQPGDQLEEQIVPEHMHGNPLTWTHIWVAVWERWLAQAERDECMGGKAEYGTEYHDLEVHEQGRSP